MAMRGRPDLAKLLAETCAIGSMPLSVSCNLGMQYLVCFLLKDPKLAPRGASRGPLTILWSVLRQR